MLQVLLTTSSLCKCLCQTGAPDRASNGQCHWRCHWRCHTPIASPAPSPATSPTRTKARCREKNWQVALCYTKIETKLKVEFSHVPHSLAPVPRTCRPACCQCCCRCLRRGPRLRLLVRRGDGICAAATAASTLNLHWLARSNYLSRSHPLFPVVAPILTLLIGQWNLIFSMTVKEEIEISSFADLIETRELYEESVYNIPRFHIPWKSRALWNCQNCPLTCTPMTQDNFELENRILLEKLD